eukprot:1703365-Amphidinium_carterae.1
MHSGTEGYLIAQSKPPKPPGPILLMGSVTCQQIGVSCNRDDSSRKCMGPLDAALFRQSPQQRPLARGATRWFTL